MEEVAARLIRALVGVRAEVISLGLQQVRREARRAITVVLRASAHERRGADAVLSCQRHDPPPVRLTIPYSIVEVGIQEEIHEITVSPVGVRDLLEEARSDDAPASPDARDLAETQR